MVSGSELAAPGTEADVILRRAALLATPPFRL